jgi:hypothetical protein
MTFIELAAIFVLRAKRRYDLPLQFRVSQRSASRRAPL